jgi:hypothetical protein
MIKCKIISEYSHGTVIEEEATFEPSTGEVNLVNYKYEIEADYGYVTAAHIELDDDSEIKVCPVCRNYIMKTVVGDRSDCSYGEYEVCSDSECDSFYINRN